MKKLFKNVCKSYINPFNSSKTINYNNYILNYVINIHSNKFSSQVLSREIHTSQIQNLNKINTIHTNNSPFTEFFDHGNKTNNEYETFLHMFKNKLPNELIDETNKAIPNKLKIYIKQLYFKYYNECHNSQTINSSIDFINFMNDSNVVFKVEKVNIKLLLPLIMEFTNNVLKKQEDSSDYNKDIMNLLLIAKYFSCYNVKPTKLLEYIEQKLIIEDALSLPDIMSEWLIILNKYNWKMNDEFTTGYIGKSITSNYTKYNYHQFYTILQTYSLFKNTEKCFWKLMEFEFISKFKRLYKQQTLAKLLESFSNTGIGDFYFWKIVDNYVISNAHHFKSQKNVIIILVSILKNFSSPLLESKLIGMIKRFDLKDLIDLHLYLESINVLYGKNINNDIKTTLNTKFKQLINNEKEFSANTQTFNNLNGDRVNNHNTSIDYSNYKILILKNYIEYNYITNIKLNEYSKEDILKFKIEGGFTDKLELIYQFSKINNNFAYYIDPFKFELKQVYLNEFINMLYFLYKNKESKEAKEVGNEFYSNITRYFGHLLSFIYKNKLKVKEMQFFINVLLISIPTFKEVTFKKNYLEAFIKDFVESHYSDDNSNSITHKCYDDLIIIRNIKDNLGLSKLKLSKSTEEALNSVNGNVISLEHSEILRNIKDLLRLSLKELNDLYKYEIVVKLKQ